MTITTDKFEKIGAEELPKDQTPKYKVGDLVHVRPGSHETAYGFYLREGMGIIVEICAFKVIGFDYYKPQPIYVVEYKIRRTDNEDCSYVVEHSLELVKTDI